MRASVTGPANRDAQDPHRRLVGAHHPAVRQLVSQRRGLGRRPPAGRGPAPHASGERSPPGGLAALAPVALAPPRRHGPALAERGTRCGRRAAPRIPRPEGPRARACQPRRRHPRHARLHVRIRRASPLTCLDPACRAALRQRRAAAQGVGSTRDRGAPGIPPGCAHGAAARLVDGRGRCGGGRRSRRGECWGNSCSRQLCDVIRNVTFCLLGKCVSIDHLELIIDFHLNSHK
jgi:hypothetical protein